MSSLIQTRWSQGKRTINFNSSPPELPERYRGLLMVDDSRCKLECQACMEVCPTQAIQVNPLRLDLGACIFCPTCTETCQTEAIVSTKNYKVSALKRQSLVVTGGSTPSTSPPSDATERHLLQIFKYSLRLRQVSAGGCGGCEAELAALDNVVFDFARFGIQFVASPRHSDGIVVTGPVTQSMMLALHKTYAAVPTPKIIIAVGACAISGGLFVGNKQLQGGVPGELPVHLYIPGCPPHPLTILDGLLRLLGRNVP